MAISNRERVGRGLDLLLAGLHPFVAREMQAKYGKNWVNDAFKEDRTLNRSVAKILTQDISELLKVVWNQWNEVFKQTLGHAERSLVSELMNARNAWAHNEPFSTDDTYRALDSISRLLTAISAPQADEVDKQKLEVLRLRLEEQPRRETRKANNIIDTNPQTGLKPWREVVTPHPDVTSGRYEAAEFAADLWQVYKDEGSDEYRNPTEFFRRTYLTNGLQQLLTNALKRLSGLGGDPVIELQTNFGGGKTHAMLALFHLFFGVSAEDLPGTEPVFTAAGVSQPPSVNIAILVGNKIPPGQPATKKDGTVVKTLWGELAWQLGGKEGYEMIRQADETATNPGDILTDLFNRFSPCLILIDEWIAYARQLHEEKDLAGGTFDTHFTFAQTLSESAKNAKNTLLVVSIPESKIEMGGERGVEALNRLKNAIGRVESPWRPASAEESFEIVRRRLFQPITDPNLFVSRDAVVRAFSDMYRHQSQEFPLECREADYERRLKQAYPIHPELFDRLYSDWSSLDKFQRTRGVLRLMAKVINALWQEGDRSLMILPANVPISTSEIQSELTRYLEDSWLPVIEKDVDGTNSLPVLLDAQNSNLGRYSASRRVTRTIYMGSAPTLQAANRGLEDRRIKLGCVQPGESTATFGDALRRLGDRATYLYIGEGNRYWISTQPNVTRTAQERASQILADKERLIEEIINRIKKDKEKGEFTGTHIFTTNNTNDILDDENMGVRLVILGPQYPHTSKSKESPAYTAVNNILNTKGTSPRYCKNQLLFIAPDQTKLDILFENVSQYLAWNSIIREKKENILNLDTFQEKQAETKQKNTNENVDKSILETYQWLLVPTQENPQDSITWEELKLSPGTDSFILRASRKAINEEYLITKIAPKILKESILNPFIWNNNHHIEISKLWSYLSNYLYLSRLKNQQVLINSIQQGIGEILLTENFAYADSYDENKQKYLGLKSSEHITINSSQIGLIVKPEIALQQIQTEQAKLQNQTAKIQTSEKNSTILNGSTSVKVQETNGTPTYTTTITPEKQISRFYGVVELDPVRISRDISVISQEVIQHLTGLVDAEVKITLEIQVNLSQPVPDHILRTVNENCRTLKFTTHSFEEE